MGELKQTRIVRIIARLNVGGPAKHVVWLTTALQDEVYRSLLVTGSVPEGEEDAITPLVKDSMENVVKLKVPIEADLSFGHNWRDMQ